MIEASVNISDAADEDTRRNCNWCGYQLIDEQVDPDLCGACFKQYLQYLEQQEDQQ
jgi:hypothetical protein